MTQMLRKQIYIPKRQQVQLKRLAKARGVSEAEVIRQAIEAVRWGRRCCEFWTLFQAAVKDEYHRHSSKRARDWPNKKKDSPPTAPRLRRLSRYERDQVERLDGGYAMAFG